MEKETFRRAFDSACEKFAKKTEGASIVDPERKEELFEMLYNDFGKMDFFVAGLAIFKVSTDAAKNEAHEMGFLLALLAEAVLEIAEEK